MKKKILILLSSVLLMLSCLPTTPPQEQENVAPPPLQENNTVVENDTQSEEPEEPPPPPPATDTPEPQPQPERIFEDYFMGSMEDGWEWIREDERYWSLTEEPDMLWIYLEPFSFGNTGPKNLLVRPAPKSDFVIETRLVFEPDFNFQFAGLMIYQDDDNVMQFGRAFCDTPNLCVGNGLYFDNFVNGQITGKNFALKIANPSDVVLRLERNGNEYIAYYWKDGDDWIEVGRQTNNLDPKYVGFVTGQAERLGLFALFDYFFITTLP